MKKLGKLSINPEKVIGSEELTSLRGGYGSNHWVQCSCGAGGEITSCDADFIRVVCNRLCAGSWTAVCV